MQVEPFAAGDIHSAIRQIRTRVLGPFLEPDAAPTLVDRDAGLSRGRSVDMMPMVSGSGRAAWKRAIALRSRLERF
jgi:hypothetical protein